MLIFQIQLEYCIRITFTINNKMEFLILNLMDCNVWSEKLINYFSLNLFNFKF